MSAGQNHSGHHPEPHRSGLPESKQNRAERTGVGAAGAEEAGPGLQVGLGRGSEITQGGGYLLDWSWKIFLQIEVGKGETLEGVWGFPATVQAGTTTQIAWGL